MKFISLLLWDMRFQARYGIYMLYGFLTALYVVLLYCFPQLWKEDAAAILIFSDPAAMGLFFMGAVVLLEKSQRVTSAFAVSPLKAFEYVCSKVLSLSLTALLVATVPVEILTFVQAVLHLFGITPTFFQIYPANVCMDLIAGRAFSVTGLILTVDFIVLLFLAAQRCVWKMWQSQGGIRL